MAPPCNSAAGELLGWPCLSYPRSEATCTHWAVMDWQIYQPCQHSIMANTGCAATGWADSHRTASHVGSEDVRMSWLDAW